MAEFDTMTASVRRAEDDPRAARKKNHQLKTDSAALGEEIGELNLEADLTQKELRRVVAEKEDKMIAHDTSSWR